MSVTIYRDLPIINGYAQFPPNHDSHKTHRTTDEALTAIQAVVPSATLVQLSQPGTNPTTGSGFGCQQFIRVPGQTHDI